MMSSTRTTAACLAILSSLAGRLHAQGVGHPPAESPFRDLRYGMNATLGAGYFDGNGGRLGLGPHDGWMYGVRFQFRSNKFISFGGQVSTGILTRRLYDPRAEVGERDKGDIDQRMTVLEAQLQGNFTANKTWHRLAPYAGIGAGAAFGASSERDSSGYEFGTKFVVTPYAGVRIMPSPRVGVRLEARAPFWKLTYPGTLRDPDDPAASSVEVSEWVVSGWYTLGIIVAF